MTKYIDATLPQKIFTYIIPILPLMMTWDNVISCIRTYSIAELKQMISTLQADDYVWEIGELESPSFKHNFTYLMGYPVNNKSSSS
jgi:hypothetical protein